MRRRSVRFARLQQVLVALAALGMLVGVRPASMVPGRLGLNANWGSPVPASVEGFVGAFGSSDSEMGLDGALSVADRDEDGPAEGDSESVDGVKLEQSVFGRTVAARSRPLPLRSTPAERMSLTIPALRRPIAAPTFPGRLPVLLCRLTC